MNTKKFAHIAMIAAIYTAVSFVPGLNTLAFGPVQIRFAEALTMLPLIYEPAVSGITLGCFLTNLLGTAAGLTGPVDIVFGTLATFLAAEVTYRMRNKTVHQFPLVSFLAPVVFNFFIVGFELAMMMSPDHMFIMMWIYGGEVAIGELIAAALGLILVKALKKTGIFN